jgi:alkanesulfonate monooxygenase SsuD/methylene tetrahydromethanopterin reductase-like flavin-dependent oxidoreductase (luciferase family)
VTVGEADAVADGEALADVVAAAEAAGEDGAVVGDWSAVGVDGEPPRLAAMMAMAAIATTDPALMPMISRLRRCRRASW